MGRDAHRDARERGARHGLAPGCRRLALQERARPDQQAQSAHLGKAFARAELREDACARLRPDRHRAVSGARAGFLSSNSYGRIDAVLPYGGRPNHGPANSAMI